MLVAYEIKIEGTIAYKNDHLQQKLGHIDKKRNENGAFVFSIYNFELEMCLYNGIESFL